MARPDQILAVDFGTSSLKAGLVNTASWEVEKTAASHYGAKKQHLSTDLTKIVQEVIRELVDSDGNPSQIRAVAVTGQMHGGVFYAQDGCVIEPLVGWNDDIRTDAGLVNALNEIAGAERSASLGTQIASGYTATLLAWFKHNQPEVYKRITHFLLPVDFIRNLFTGQSHYATDPTNAGGTGMFNTRNGVWHWPFIEQLGLRTSMFPAVHSATALAGLVSKEFAAASNLSAGVPIVMGGGDNQMSMLGSGLVNAESPVLINIGTGSQVSKVVAHYHKYPGIDTRPYFNQQYALVGASMGGGGSYQWLQDQLQIQTGQQITYRELDQLAAQESAGAGGLYFCPGPSRTDPDRRPGFGGTLRQSAAPGQKARAVLEGILFDLYASYQTYAAENPSPEILGAGKMLQVSPAAAQIAADIFGKPVRVSQTDNILVGAAMVAGIGLGVLKDWGACQMQLLPTKSYTPDPGNHAAYQSMITYLWSIRPIG